MFCIVYLYCTVVYGNVLYYILAPVESTLNYYHKLLSSSSSSSSLSLLLLLLLVVVLLLLLLFFLTRYQLGILSEMELSSETTGGFKMEHNHNRFM